MISSQSKQKKKLKKKKMKKKEQCEASPKISTGNIRKSGIRIVFHVSYVCVYALHDRIVKSGAHTNFTIPQSMCTPVAFSPMKLTLLVVASLVALS